MVVAVLASGCGGGGSSGKPAAGAVGTHVWTASSSSLELRHMWSSTGTTISESGSQCWYVGSASLSDAQRTLLEGLTLVPLTDACTADGYDIYQLTIYDLDGSQAVYRNTGCSSLRVPGAQAMLPPDAFPNDAFPANTAVNCVN